VDVLRGKGTAVSGPVPGLAAIGASVGQGGANRRIDVKAVQTALNAVPVVLGGAGGALAVDGLIGPKTLGAIGTFQSMWIADQFQDGRCDPRGPTLALLNAMAGVGDALPSGTATSATVPARQGLIFAAAVGAPKPKPPSPAEKVRIRNAEHRQVVIDQLHLPKLVPMLLGALRVNDAAREHVKRLKALKSGGTLPAQALADQARKSFLLVAKIFRLHERAPADAGNAVDKLDIVLRRSIILVSSRLPPRPPGVAPVPPSKNPLFVSLFDNPSSSPAGSFGYSSAGGALTLAPGGTGFFNKSVKPGVVVEDKKDRIYLLPAFDTLSDVEQKLTLLHELAHETISEGGQFDDSKKEVTVGDPVRWKSLSSANRLRNAENFGWFTTECNFGTKEAVKDCRTTLDTIGEFPSVDVTIPGIGRDPDILLPQAGSAEAAKFSFPGGFS
jgi:hypothetical protein